MTTFKKGDRVRIKATATKEKYNSGGNPGWDGPMGLMVGKDHTVGRVTDMWVCIGYYSFLFEDVELATAGLQPYDAVKVDAITGKIVYDAAVAVGKKPVWSLGSEVVIFMDKSGLNGWSSRILADNSGDPLNYLSLGEFIERLLVKTEEPLKYKDWTVEIKPGSVTIGCTTVDNATVKKIIAGMGGTKKHSLQDGDCVAIKDKALREWVACETTARSGVKPYDPTSTVNFPVFVYRKHHPAFVGNDNTNDRNELTIDQWLERCSGEVITTKQGNVQFNKDSITIGEYELPNELVKKIGEKLID